MKLSLILFIYLLFYRKERRENLNLTTDQKTETENLEFITEIDLVSAELKDVNISNAVMIVENSNCLKNSNRKRFKRKRK